MSERQTPEKIRIERKPEAFSVTAPRGDSPGTVEGYAVRYGVNSSDRGGYVVRFEPGSMRLPADGRDVRALYGHDELHVLGRTGNGTLRLSEDDAGVRFELDLPATQAGRDVAELLRRRDVSGMSFGMFGLSHRWEQDDGVEVKVVEAFELDEVTATGNPAFREATAALKEGNGGSTYGRMSAPKNGNENGGEARAESKDVREVFGEKKAEAEEIVSKARDENRGMSDEEKEQFGGLKAELAQLRDQLKAEHELAELEIGQFGRAAVSSAKKVATAAHSPRVESKAESDEFEVHRAQVERYLKTGVRPEKFTITTGSGSGVLLPTRVGTPYVISSTTDAFRRAILSRGLRPIETTDTATFGVPVFDDSDNAAVTIAQDATADVVADPDVAGVTLSATLFTSKTVWLSNTAVASMPNLLSFVGPMLDRRMDRRRESGIVGTLGGLANVVTAGAADGVTYDELLDLQHAISPADRANGVFVVSDGLFRAIRGLTDDGGNPIYQVSLRDGAPDTLLGWPIFVSEGMAGVGAGNVTAVAANAEGILIRDVVGGPGARRVARYSEIPSRPDQVGFNLFANGDGAIIDSAAAVLKQAAS